MTIQKITFTEAVALFPKKSNTQFRLDFSNFPNLTPVNTQTVNTHNNNYLNKPIQQINKDQNNNNNNNNNNEVKQKVQRQIQQNSNQNNTVTIQLPKMTIIEKEKFIRKIRSGFIHHMNSEDLINKLKSLTDRIAAQLKATSEDKNKQSAETLLSTINSEINNIINLGAEESENASTSFN